MSDDFQGVVPDVAVDSAPTIVASRLESPRRLSLSGVWSMGIGGITMVIAFVLVNVRLAFTMAMAEHHAGAASYAPGSSLQPRDPPTFLELMGAFLFCEAFAIVIGIWLAIHCLRQTERNKTPGRIGLVLNGIAACALIAVCIW